MSSAKGYEHYRLTPFGVVVTCFLVFALVAASELDGLVAWFEEHCNRWTVSVENECERPPTLGLSANARAFSQRLATTENTLSTIIQDLPALGAAWAGHEPTPLLTISPSIDNVPVSDTPQTPSSILHPTRVLIIGDSMVVEGFGTALQRRLTAYGGLVVVREGRYSTGLSRPDYFDWQTHFATLLDKHHPDLVVINMGANDPQDIMEQGKRYRMGEAGWNTIYSQRANHLLAQATTQGAAVVWVGLPIMGQAKYGAKIRTINSLIAQVCASYPTVKYLDTWQILATAQGSYTPFLKNTQGRLVRVRAKDEIHLTEAGGEILTDHVLNTLQPFVAWSGQGAPPGQ